MITNDWLNNPEFASSAALKRWAPILNTELQNLKSDPESLLARAILTGYLIGDGYVAQRVEGKFLRFDTEFAPDDLNMARTYVDAYSSVYGRKLPIKKKKGYFTIRSTHKTAVKDLLRFCNYGKMVWEIPFELLSNRKAKQLFLRAYFDCEAHVNNRVIRVESVNKNGLLQVKELLNEFGITSNFYAYERKNKHWNTNFILVIGRKAMRRTFLNEIGFNHEKKLKVLSGSVAKPG